MSIADMFIASKYYLKVSIYMLLIVVIIAQALQVIFLRRRFHEAGEVVFNTRFIHYKTNCWYRWQWYFFQVDDCDSQVDGKLKQVIGRVTMPSDSAIFEQKMLNIQSIRPIDSKTSSVISWVMKKSAEISLQKQHIFNTIDAQIFLSQERIMLAILAGSSSYLSNQQRHFVEVTGMQHIFAISGMHISLILGLLAAMFRSFWPKNYALPLVVVGIFVAFLAGAKESAVRATMMAVLSLVFHRCWHRTVPSWWLLFITALGMVAIHPWYLFDVGFQLSVTAVVAVLLAARTLIFVDSELASMLTGNISLLKKRKRRMSLSSITSYVFQTSVVSLFVLLITSPVALLHFGKVSILGLIANPAVLWLVPMVLLSSFALLIEYLVFRIGIIPLSLFSLIRAVTSLPAFLVEQILKTIAKIDVLDLTIQNVSTLHLVGYYLLLFAVWLCSKRIYSAFQRKHV